MVRRVKEEDVSSRTRWSDSVDTLKAKIAHNTERLRELQESAQDKMAENPITTALIAFGVGVVCGVGLKVLLESRRR